MTLSQTAQFRPVEHAAGKVMDGELVVINFHSGLYYSSVGIGTAIWQLMEAGQSLGAIAATIARDTGASAGMVETDVTGFIEQLLSAGVIEAASGPASSVAVEYSGTYATPSLTSFHDLEQSVAIDPPLQR